MSENNSHNEKSDPGKLKDDLEKAEEKIETMEKKLEEQEKKTSSMKHYKSEGVTLVLSIIVGLLGILGVGHMYVGRIKRGIGILIAGFFIWVIVFIPVGMQIPSVTNEDLLNEAELVSSVYVGIVIAGILYVALFIWQILNSRKLCRQYNEYYEQHGTAPW